MDSSTLTAKRKGLVLIGDYRNRLHELATGKRKVARPIVGGGGGADAEWVIDRNDSKAMSTAAECESCAGPVPPTPPTPPTPPIIPTFGEGRFFLISSFASFPSFMYRIYNPDTDTWTPYTNSYYNVDISSIVDYNYPVGDLFSVGFHSDKTNTYQFFDASGAMFNKVSFSTAGTRHGVAPGKRAFGYYSETTSSVTIGALFYETNTQIAKGIPGGTYNLMHGMYSSVYAVVNYTGLTDHYLLTQTSTAPPVKLFSSNDYIVGNSLYSDYVAGAAYNGGYYTELFLITNDGDYSMYALPAGTYIKGYVQQYGIHNSRTYVKLYNNVTGLYDFYIFSGTSPLTPIAIQTDVCANHRMNLYSIYDDHYVTAQTNNMSIHAYYPSMNCIGDGGCDMFDFGNYVDLSGSSSDGSFTINSIPYGTCVRQPTFEFMVSYGDAAPHIVAIKTDSGVAHIETHGNLGSDLSGAVTNYAGTYASANSRYGKYWVNSTANTMDPSVCELWFTVEQALWGSSTALVTDARKTTDARTYRHYVEVSGTNYLFCKVVLARRFGVAVSALSVENFLKSYVNDMPLDNATFSNNNLLTVKTWHAANAQSYYVAQVGGYFTYTYDGGVSEEFNNSTVYALIDDAVVFTVDNFNYVTTDANINYGGIFVPWKDGANYKVRLYKYGTQSDTTLMNTAGTIEDTYNMRLNDYYFHAIYNGATWAWYLLNTANVVVASGTQTAKPVTTPSGPLIAFATDTGAIKYIVGGTAAFTSAQTFVNPHFYTCYPHTATGSIFVLDSNNQLLCIKQDGTTTYTALPTGHVSHLFFAERAVFTYDSPYRIFVVDADGNTYSYNSYNINLVGTQELNNNEKMMCAQTFNESTSKYGYVVYNSDSNTFSVLNEVQNYTSENDLTANYYYQAY